jgi:hypothetical protein
MCNFIGADAPQTVINPILPLPGLIRQHEERIHLDRATFRLTVLKRAGRVSGYWTCERCKAAGHTIRLFSIEDAIREAKAGVGRHYVESHPAPNLPLTIKSPPPSMIEVAHA